jgi:tetratricopeptide (TPR) repeat protein
MQALRNTSSSHRRLAASLDKLGDYQGALENYQYSLRVVSEATANNRASGEFRRSEAIYTIKVGAALHKVGETTRAIEMVKRGLDLNSKYIAENKNRAYAVRYSSEAFQPATDFLIAIGRREQAIAAYQEWLKLFENLRENMPREPDLVWWLANIYAKIGDACSAFKQETKSISATNRAKLGDARRWYQKSLETLGELRELQNDSPDIQDLRSATEENLAQCEIQLK